MIQVHDYSQYRSKNNYQIYPEPQSNWDNKDQNARNGCQVDGNVETNQMIHQTTNSRIYQRNLPSQTLQPYIDVRPVATKYSLLPIVDPRAKPTVPYVNLPDYHVAKTFNPGDRQSPWSGYSTNINNESELQNQIFALQRCNQAVYVPSSMSDLYDVKAIIPSQIVEQPFPGLFQTENFDEFNPNPENIAGRHTFLNNTRMEYRDANLHSACG